MPLRVAILERRLHDLHIAKQFDDVRLRMELPTFGGNALLAMENGEIDAMADPLKGQPEYEALIWGEEAQQAGFIVSTPRGESIDFVSILRKNQETGD